MRNVLGEGEEHMRKHILIILMRDDARDNVSRLQERQAVALPFNMHDALFRGGEKKKSAVAQF
jgi:hypothetical protein